MDNRPVLYMDSGIGGAPYCLNFIRRNPKETVHYLGDRLNFPYGPRKREELVSIMVTLVGKLVKSFNPKIVVLACNTATISAINELREHFPGIFFVGTVPEIQPAVQASKTGKIGVIATERTISDPIIRKLAGDKCEVIGIAAPELVDFINNRFHFSCEKEKRETAKGYTDRFRAAGADGIVLGCTHFLFLKEEFRQEAAPYIQIFDSVDRVTRTAESLLDDNGKALRNGALDNEKEQSLFLLTGTEKADSSWQKWADYMGFPISLFGAD